VGRLSHLVGRALSLADASTDDDDLRLRKRMGVAAGYITAVAVLTMPLFAQGHIVAIAVAGSTFALCVLNLAVLARTRRFERYVAALVVAGGVFVALATWLGGGPTLTYAGLVWVVLVPALAVLALGPASAGRWYAAFIAVVAASVALDLIWHEPTGVDPYPIQLAGSVFHIVASFSIVFAMLVYSDRRRREALVSALAPASLSRGMHRPDGCWESVAFAGLVSERPSIFALRRTRLLFPSRLS